MKCYAVGAGILFKVEEFYKRNFYLTISDIKDGLFKVDFVCKPIH